MAEKEYIEKKDLKKIIKANAWSNPAVPNAVNVIIDRTPAADVVEIVRCKDCVHYQNGACNHFGYYIYAPDVDEDDFCSYGERKERE
jgi:hypothetical protein